MSRITGRPSKPGQRLPVVIYGPPYELRGGEPAGGSRRGGPVDGERPTSSLVDVEFEPEGLQFQRAAKLTLSYKDCEVPAGLDLLVAYVGLGNRILELPVSQDYRAYSEVTGDIHHFSRYAVAY